jgi:preprotein translocase subunit SecG
MYTLFSILILISSIVLVLIVLVQNSKGGGLASGFASSNNVLGVRKTTDFLEKATWTLAGAVIFFCITITAFIDRDVAGEQKSVATENAVAPMQMPIMPDGFGTQAQPTEQPAEQPAEQPTEQQPAEQPAPQ